jgi:molecular chaperone HtpG
MSAETYGFQTETKQLLDLMVHSVYSNKDIFLRELISNASDALDKRRFESIRNPDALPSGTELEVRIEADRAARTLSVIDNGIGMSREEVIEHIGTIAKSGTREFLDSLKAAKNGAGFPELIGQFGIGFYSSFMAADRIVLVTRRAGEIAATRWESTGEGTFTVEQADRSEVGTTVTLHLKPADAEDGLHDYTDEWVVKDIVKRYSDFVAYPIRMEVERRNIERDETGKPKEGAQETVTREVETLNSMKAIWLRDKSEVTEEEYNEFYKHISHDWHEPLKRIQAHIEGILDYRLLIFIPKSAGADLFHQEKRHGVQLYVKRVFILDDCEALLPTYLRFIRGVVDSEDLSLNVSREMLQQNRQIQRMRNGVVSKVLDTLGDMRDTEPEGYKAFWKEFGRVLKEGLFQDTDNRPALLELMLCASTHAAGELITLRDYVSRMKPEQNTIYFMTGRSRTEIENSPHLEAFREKGYEVLLLSDPVDEVWTQSVFEFDGKRLQSVGKGAVDLGTDEEKKQTEETRKEKEHAFGAVIECLKAKLAEHVKEVRLSNRLTTSAACLVGDAFAMTPQLEQMMRALGEDLPPVKRILELNPNHPLLPKLKAILEKDKDDPALGDYAELVFGQAVLAEGSALRDPARFSRLVAELMTRAL